MDGISRQVDAFERLFNLAATAFVGELVLAAVALLIWLAWRRAARRARAARLRRERLERFAFLRVD